MCVPAWAGALLTGIPGVVNGVLKYAEKKADANVAINGQNTQAATALGVEQLRSEVAARGVLANLASQHEKLVSWIGAAFVLHVWAMVLDTVFHLGWKITEIPGTIGQYEGQFLLFLIGGGAVSSIGKVLIAKVWK